PQAGDGREQDALLLDAGAADRLEDQAATREHEAGDEERHAEDGVGEETEVAGEPGREGRRDQQEPGAPEENRENGEEGEGPRLLEQDRDVRYRPQRIGDTKAGTRGRVGGAGGVAQR